MNFYSVIIGTELLNGRRVDGHFEYVNNQLLKRGWVQKASFVIKDEPSFMEDVFNLVKKDDMSVMFCFGGIGSTPDDYTRACAANVFSNGKMDLHQQSLNLMAKHIGEQNLTSHHRTMATLPVGAKLLKNIINNVSGFYLQDRFFFMPGFVNMSHPMVNEALDKFYAKNPEQTYKKVLLAYCKESFLIDYMKELPKSIDLSSLPMMREQNSKTLSATSLHLSSTNKQKVDREFDKLIKLLEQNNIEYEIGDKQI